MKILLAFVASIAAGCGMMPTEEFVPSDGADLSGGLAALETALERLLAERPADQIGAAKAELQKQALDIEARLLRAEPFSGWRDATAPLRLRVLQYAGDWPEHQAAGSARVREAWDALKATLSENHRRQEGDAAAASRETN